MKAVILAGGLGTRLSEQTEFKPKPMVEIGGQPILWHIMKHYAHHGVKEFGVALGYRGDVVKRFFLDCQALSGNLTIDLASGGLSASERATEDWKIHLVDTGTATNTGGRVRRMRSVVGSETFMATYGDGVCDIDLTALLRFHKEHGRLATLTAVRPPARFGGLVFDGDVIAQFTEKPQIGEGWINGGFFILEPGIFDYIDGDESSFEAHALEHLARDRQLVALRHEGFWQCMDTLRDLRLLESLWQTGKAPWKLWR